MQNKALSIFSPILTKLNEIANSDQFSKIIDGLLNGLAAVSKAATVVFGFMTSAAAFIVDNWSLIAPIIYGIAAALLLYNGYLITHNAIQAISNGLKTLAAIRAVAHGTATASRDGSNRRIDRGTTLL